MSNSVSLGLEMGFFVVLFIFDPSKGFGLDSLVVVSIKLPMRQKVHHINMKKSL